MTTPDVITIETILSGAEYEPRPGLEYEIIRGVRARMKDPTEGVIEAFEAIQNEGSRDDTDADITDRTYRAAAAVLDVDHVDIVGADRKRCLRVVVDMVGQDFFALSAPRLSAHMKSLAEAIRSARADGNLSAEASRNGALPDGPAGSEQGKAAGRTEPSS